MTSLKDKLQGNYIKTQDIDLLSGYGRTQKRLIGDRGSTFANVTTGKELESEIAHRITAMGPQRGAIKFYDADLKTELKNATFYSNELGKMVTTDANGMFMYGNKAYVTEAVKFHQEREDLIDKYAEECKVSNQLCAYMLGYESVAKLEEVLGKDKSFKVDGVDIEDDVKAVSGMPEAIRRMAPGTDRQLAAIAKLRLLVGNRLDHINLMDFGRKKSDKDDLNVVAPATVTP